MITDDDEKPTDPPKPDAKPTAREVYLEELTKNPRWKEVPKTGRGFVIGGVKPQK